MVKRVRSLMNEKAVIGSKTYINGVEVKYNDEIEVDSDFIKSSAYKNMKKQKCIEDVIEEIEKNEIKTNN